MIWLISQNRLSYASVMNNPPKSWWLHTTKFSHLYNVNCTSYHIPLLKATSQGNCSLYSNIGSTFSITTGVGDMSPGGSTTSNGMLWPTNDTSISSPRGRGSHTVPPNKGVGNVIFLSAQRER